MTSMAPLDHQAAAKPQNLFLRTLKLLGPGIIAVLSWLARAT